LSFVISAAGEVLVGAGEPFGLDEDTGFLDDFAAEPTLKSDISESVIHQPMSGAQRVVRGRRGPRRLLSR